MSLKVTLAVERQRREAAEAEVALLRSQLEVATAAVAATRLPSPDAALKLAEVISQLKQTEQQLENQQDLVRRVVDTSPNLVYVEDEEGRCILANKRYVQLMSQLPHCPWPAENQADKLVDPISDKNAFSIDTTTSFEETYLLGEGETLWFYTTKSCLARIDGSRYLITFSSDITDLKRAHRLAEESIRAKQVFMTNMSHEIRTPLHGVMGLSELLKKEPLSAEQSDYVEMIQASTENLLVLINDILDFAKIESGTITLENTPFDILKTVQGAVRSLSFKTDEKGLLLRVVGLNESLPLAKGDPFRLHQVLVNLISNAIKFTHKGAITVTIDGSGRDGRHLPVTFSVADTGIGISADNLSQVFNSFRQADSSIPRLYGGTGLGLTICKNLVELQGGEIGVRSTLGQGSCFYFTIPYEVSDEVLPTEATAIQQPDLLRGLSVLLAEDDTINLLIAMSLLDQWKIDVDMAQNGEEALAKARRRKYDIILMDVQMPQLDGIDATARLRAGTGLNRNTPIIALTADAIRITPDSYQSLGFTDYLTKPYNQMALYNIIAQVSGRPVDAPPVPALLASADSGLHYDFNTLGKLATDTDFIRKMLGLFVTRVPGQVEDLQNAIDQENWKAAALGAHTLKSTFASLNIQPEAQYLKRLEELAELGVPSSEFNSLLESVSKATALFSSLFLAKIAALEEADMDATQETKKA